MPAVITKTIENHEHVTRKQQKSAEKTTENRRDSSAKLRVMTSQSSVNLPKTGLKTAQTVQNTLKQQAMRAVFALRSDAPTHLRVGQLAHFIIIRSIGPHSRQLLRLFRPHLRRFLSLFCLDFRGFLGLCRLLLGSFLFRLSFSLI